MSPALIFEAVCDEGDIVEIFVSASNSQFSGSTRLYDSAHELGLLAKRLKGFPRTIDDKLEYSAGNSSHGAQLRFYCVDAVGHTAVFVTINDGVSEHGPREDVSQSVALEVPCEPQAIEEFAESLTALAESKSGKAILR